VVEDVKDTPQEAANGFARTLRSQSGSRGKQGPRKWAHPHRRLFEGWVEQSWLSQ
jgi:hypothetical protein